MLDVGAWRVLLDDVYDLLFDGNCYWMIAGAFAVGCWMLVRGGFCWMMWTTCCLLLVVAGCIDGECCCGGIGRVVLGVVALLLISWE